MGLDQEVKTLRLLSLKDIEKYLKSKYNYLHVGCIQIAFKPLTLAGLNASILSYLRDARCLDFLPSLMGIIQTSLCHGPVYFNVYPNLTLSLTDRNLFEAVSLHIQTQGYNYLPGSETISVIYRIHYKVMNTLTPNAILRSEPGKTIVIDSNCLTTNIAIPKLIKWEEIDFPHEWVVQDAVPPVNIMNRNLNQITQTPEGDVEITFAPNKISKLSLTRSSSAKRIEDYKVSYPSSLSRYSVSNDELKEQIIRGLKISDQQIPHGVYVEQTTEQEKEQRTSPTQSEMSFHL